MYCQVITQKSTRCSRKASLIVILRTTGQSVSCCTSHANYHAKGKNFKGISPNVNAENNIEERYQVVAPIVLDSEYKCLCCFDELPTEQLIHCSCFTQTTPYHMFCAPCVSGYIASGIQDKKANMGCMLGKACNGGKYDISQIEPCLLDQQMKDALHDQLQVDYMRQLKTENKEFEICMSCEKWGVFVPSHNHKNKTYTNIKCQLCDGDWCMYCRKKGHSTNVSCNQLDNNSTKEQVVTFIANFLTTETSHQCPCCFTKYVKLDGCNRIKCPHCAKASCFICGVTVNHYEHFDGTVNNKNKEKCPLWNDYTMADRGNKKYHQIQMRIAEKKLIDENKTALPKINQWIQEELNKYKDIEKREEQSQAQAQEPRAQAPRAQAQAPRAQEPRAQLPFYRRMFARANRFIFGI